MAVGADGRVCVPAQREVTMDSFPVLRFLLRMALSAGVRHVEMVDRGFGIAARQNAVGAALRAVTADADRRQIVAALVREAVHARLVALPRVGELDVELARQVDVVVTAGTGLREIADVDGRHRIGNGQDLMGSVTVAARRHTVGDADDAEPVPGVLVPDVLVAASAGDRSKVVLVRDVRDVGMTIGAGESLMYRVSQLVLRDRRNVGIGSIVAHQTIAVVEIGGSREPGEPAGQSDQERTGQKQHARQTAGPFRTRKTNVHDRTFPSLRRPFRAPDRAVGERTIGRKSKYGPMVGMVIRMSP
ncbi:MAG: hypothetical protein R3E12_07890 [Candidatus Eisenbacteria bacterium]